jgi:hypothetical protein
MASEQWLPDSGRQLRSVRHLGPGARPAEGESARSVTTVVLRQSHQGVLTWMTDHCVPCRCTRKVVAQRSSNPRGLVATLQLRRRGYHAQLSARPTLSGKDRCPYRLGERRDLRARLVANVDTRTLRASLGSAGPSLFGGPTKLELQHSEANLHLSATASPLL